MHTLYLGDDEVDAYLADFVQRLTAQEETQPTVWFPIGSSGAILARRLLQNFPALVEKTHFVEVAFDRSTEALSFDSSDLDADIRGRRVLILDSAIHSGFTMLKVADRVSAHKPASMASYALVMKRSSSFVPTMWAVTIGDHDRAYFLLNPMPNNRLSEQAVCGHLRKLQEADIGRDPLISGTQSIDNTTWADRWYDMRSSERERRTYLLEDNATLVGLITFSRKRVGNRKALMVDEVAVGQGLQRRGYGEALMRWAETSARKSRCHQIRLWAIQNKVDWYKKFDFKEVLGEKEMGLGNERYTLMEKKVISHV